MESKAVFHRFKWSRGQVAHAGGIFCLPTHLPRFALALVWALASPVPSQADCSLTSIGATPIPDLGPRLYRGFEGGLYPGGSNQMPNAHAAEGLSRALTGVQPLDTSGQPDAGAGKIGFITVGMSNTRMVFSDFLARTASDPAVNPQLVILNTAQGGQDSVKWLDPQAAAWQTVDNMLQDAGLTPAQVQVVWIKQARGGTGTFPEKARGLQTDLETICRNLKTLYPNIQLAYLSSRTRAYTLEGLSPEPVAYELGYSVKWLIESQIGGSNDVALTVAPWLSWGPYIWTDGMVSRSDGFVWECDDVAHDFVHPTSSGRKKVGEQLMGFFKTNPTSAPWFLKPSTQPPLIIEKSASTLSGPVGTTVNFSALASDPDGIAEYVWGFDDGMSGQGTNVTKSFLTPGDHNVQLTVTDNLGNSSTDTIPIQITASGGNTPPSPSFEAAPTVGDAPLTVSLDASASTDDGVIVSHEWDLDDGFMATGPQVTNIYHSPGSYQITLTVTDDGDLSGELSTLIVVTDPASNQQPTASFIYVNDIGPNPLDVDFDANASTDIDGSIVSYTWDFGDGTMGVGINTTHTYAAYGMYHVDLTVVDNEGASNMVNRIVELSAPPPNLNISNLSVASGNGYEIVTNGLIRGATLYIDQLFAFGSVPESLEGRTYIRTSFDDRTITTNPFLTFDINHTATIYVIHGDDGPPPAWLDAFNQTGDELIVGPVTFRVFAKEFEPGPVVLGPNVEQPGASVASMYVVVLDPQIAEIGPSLTLETGQGDLQLILHGEVGQAVEIMASTNLLHFHWQTVCTGTIGADGLLSYTNVGATNSPVRFYRTKSTE